MKELIETMENSSRSLLRENLLLENLLQQQRKLRFRLHCYAALFVVVVSFLYGFSAGMKGKVAEASSDPGAFAGEFSNASMILSTDASEEDPLVIEKLSVPDDVVPASFGRDVMINGKKAAMLSFFTNRSIDALIAEQQRKWRAQGFKVFGGSRGKRGVLIAFDPTRGERYSMSAMLVPGQIRNLVSQGYKVQGVLSYAETALGNIQRAEESVGLVPGVPLLPGGKGGAVFSAEEQQGRSYSGVYTVSGTVSESITAYRDALLLDQWRETANVFEGEVHSKAGSLSFRRGNEELTLLFAARPRFFSGATQTVVTVVLRPIV